MKSTIQFEAEKAAKKIREALEEFNRVTGLAAYPGANWIQTAILSEKSSSTHLVYASLEFGGVEVKA